MEKVILKSRALGLSSFLAMASMAGSAHFPGGISDGGLGSALRRPTRHRGIVIDTTAREIKDAEIRAWNKAVDEKKAARKRAKAAS